MAETLRIEIPIETVDNTDPGVSNATKKFEKMERAANSANSSAKKASDTVSKFDKQAQKTEKSLASWAKEKYEVLLEAKERISPVLSTLGNGLRSFAGKQGLRGRNVTGPGYKRSHQHRACQTDE